MINTNQKFHPKNDIRKNPNIIIIPFLYLAVHVAKLTNDPNNPFTIHLPYGSFHFESKLTPNAGGQH